MAVHWTSVPFDTLVSIFHTQPMGHCMVSSALPIALGSVLALQMQRITSNDSLAVASNHIQCPLTSLIPSAPFLLFVANIIGNFQRIAGHRKIRQEVHVDICLRSALAKGRKWLEVRPSLSRLVVSGVPPEICAKIV